MDNTVAILSLAIAVFVVFVGPVVSWIVSKRQQQLSLAIANKQIIAPMRQAWINHLRDLLAELSSSTRHYWAAGFENRRDEEYQRLVFLQHKVVMMLNPLEADHLRLEELIRKMISSLERGREGEEDFWKAHRSVMDLSRQVFKREWNRVRDEI
ncbi:MAG: hypothetical protein ACRELG_19520 [Gemmataceae bacterium]